MGVQGGYSGFSCCKEIESLFVSLFLFGIVSKNTNKRKLQQNIQIYIQIQYSRKSLIPQQRHLGWQTLIVIVTPKLTRIAHNCCVQTRIAHCCVQNHIYLQSYIFCICKTICFVHGIYFCICKNIYFCKTYSFAYAKLYVLLNL